MWKNNSYVELGGGGWRWTHFSRAQTLTNFNLLSVIFRKLSLSFICRSCIFRNDGSCNCGTIKIVALWVTLPHLSSFSSSTLLRIFFIASTEFYSIKTYSFALLTTANLYWPFMPISLRLYSNLLVKICSVTLSRKKNEIVLIYQRLLSVYIKFSLAQVYKWDIHTKERFRYWSIIIRG